VAVVAFDVSPLFLPRLSVREWRSWVLVNTNGSATRVRDTATNTEEIHVNRRMFAGLSSQSGELGSLSHPEAGGAAFRTWFAERYERYCATQ
jgi:hypothetical protein